jgi:type II secretory pathway component PulK
VVIVVVTVVILLVALAGYGFLMLMQTEHMAAHARGDQLQAQSVALSGREYLASILDLPRSEREPAGMEDPSELYGHVLVDGDPDSAVEGEREGRFAILSPSDGEFAEQAWRFGYTNESAKLHLSLLLQIDARDPGAGRDALMTLPAMDESTADAILDWIDADDQQRDQGAESEYYMELDTPRQPRNGVPPTLEELLLVRGVTRERLLGIDLNGNFAIDPYEQQLASEQADATSAGMQPWSRYLTVYSAERDEMYDGSPRVRLNQEDLRVLHAELSAIFDTSWANFIVAYRQYGPYRGSGASGDASELPLDLSKPTTRRIRSPLDLIGVRVGIREEDDDQSSDGRKKKQKVQVFASPFEPDPGVMREYLPKLMDSVTVGSGSPLRGRVNIQMAPPEVLSALPGVDMAIADRIVSARSMLSDGDQYRHPVWLLLEQIVDRRQMRQLEPYVTTGGDVARAQIVGYYDARSPIARFDTVLDGTSDRARQLYYKDLRRLGRGVVDELLDESRSP